MCLLLILLLTGFVCDKINWLIDWLIGCNLVICRVFLTCTVRAALRVERDGQHAVRDAGVESAVEPQLVQRLAPWRPGRGDAAHHRHAGQPLHRLPARQPAVIPQHQQVEATYPLQPHSAAGLLPAATRRTFLLRPRRQQISTLKGFCHIISDLVSTRSIA